MDTHNRHGDVLVVDDDSATVELLVELLSDSGYAVRRARNSTEVFMTISEHLPALLLLDLWMPGMDGALVSRELRRHHPTLPIVLVTAAASEGQPLLVDGLVDCVIAKPFDLDELLACVARYMPATYTRIAVGAPLRWCPYPDLWDRSDELLVLSRQVHEQLMLIEDTLATLKARSLAVGARLAAARASCAASSILANIAGQ